MIVIRLWKRDDDSDKADTRDTGFVFNNNSDTDMAAWASDNDIMINTRLKASKLSVLFSSVYKTVQL